MVLSSRSRFVVNDFRNARTAVFFVERLEDRQFLSGDVLDAPIGPVAIAGQALHATTLGIEETVHETRVTLVTPSRIDDNTSKTLTATVTTTDPEAPAPAGSVAFFTTGNKDLRGIYAVVSVPDGAGGTTTGYLLGIAAIDGAGTATLSIDQMPLGKHTIVAVYLGVGAPIAPQSTDGLPAFNASSSVAKNLIATPTSPAEITRSVVVDTKNRYFRIAFGRIKARGTAPESFHTIPDSGLHLLQEEHEIDTTIAQAFFGPIDVPLRIDAVAKKLTVDDDGVARFYYVYHYRITPVGIPSSLSDLNAQFAGSASAASTMHVTVTTDVEVRIHGATTVTNPPTVTASVIRPDGTLLGADWPAPVTRGGIQSASAGLKPAGTAGTAAAVAAAATAAEADEVPLGDRSVVTSGELPERRLPTGIVMFFDGDERIGKAFLDADGNATLLPKSRSLAFGLHTIRAVYKGDDDYARASDPESESAHAEINLTRTETEITVAFNKTLVTAGDVWQLYADVKTRTADLIIPKGKVRFFMDGEIVGTISLGSQEKLERVFTTGTHTISAKYLGDTDTLKSVVTSGEITTNKIASFLAVFPSAFPNVPGQPVKMGSYVSTGKEKILVPTGDIRIELVGGDNAGEVVGRGVAFEPFQFDFDFEVDKEYRFKGFYDGDDNTLAGASGEFILVREDGEIKFKLP